MAFSEEIKAYAYSRAGGRCERCGKFCHREEIGGGYLYPGFEFHHRLSLHSGGGDGANNCEFLCRECHVRTKSYGRH